MVVLTEKETAAVVSNIPNNLANGNGNANTLTNGSDDHGIGAELSSTEAQKPFQMKRKLPDDSQFTTDGDPKNQKTEDGSRYVCVLSSIILPKLFNKIYSVLN